MEPNDQPSFFSGDEGNPLLMGLGPQLTFQEWKEKLSYDPSRSWQPTASVPELMNRVDDIQSIIAPTYNATQTCLKLQRMQRLGYRARDPRVKRNQKILYSIAGQCEERKGRLTDSNSHLLDLEKPWYDTFAQGQLNEGPPGCGKSHGLKAFTRVTPQVIEHGKSEEYGWTYLAQLVHLTTSMPADLARSTFFDEIVCEVDSILGTAFRDNVLKKKAPMQNQVVRILALHRCGLLAVDEQQGDNVGLPILGTEFVGFFLRLINAAVPVSCIGNPLAFVHLKRNTQAFRRIIEGGYIAYGNYTHWTDLEWQIIIMGRIWAFNVLPLPDQEIPNLHEIVWNLTGGIPTFVARLRKVCLMTALYLGSSCVTPQIFDIACREPEVLLTQDLVDAYRRRDYDSLRKAYNDQPSAFLQAYWKANPLPEVPSKEPGASEGGSKPVTLPDKTADTATRSTVSSQGSGADEADAALKSLQSTYDQVATSDED